LTKSKIGSLFENKSFQNQPSQIARRLIFGMWTWFGPLLKIFGKKIWRAHQVPSIQFFAKRTYYKCMVWAENLYLALILDGGHFFT